VSADVDPSDFSATTPALDKTLDEAVAAGAVAGIARSPAGHHGHVPLHTHCENCGTKLEGPFCHRCGQHDYPVHRSFRHAVYEALENLFHFEGKFFRNVITLLFRPGALTAEFNAGKRASQMPPFRLYLFVSVLFFVGFFPRQALMPGTTWNVADADVKLDLQTEATRAAAAAAASHGKEGKAVAANDSERAIRRLLERMMDDGYRQKVAAEFVHSLPKLLLIALPLLALYTRVLFRGSGQVYLQHLVMSLHFHTFVYLWLMFAAGWSGLLRLVSPGIGSLVDTLCNVWLSVYAVWMLHRLYGNGWGTTLAKAVLLTVLYSLTLGAIFLAGFFLLLAAE
jgi:hypothetical protein